MDSKLECLRNKGEHAHSANASQEVREHLAGFIRSKRGSSTQINTIAHPSQQHASQKSTSSAADGTNNYDRHANHDQTSSYCGPVPSSSSSSSHDHPLRKTASMPTMHIPYKAQSLSRRRQMERRTTMSPLLKRNKSRPRRPLLHSQDAGVAEYSSNPCIRQSSSSLARSLSQSNSPPPASFGTIGSQDLRNNNNNNNNNNDDPRESLRQQHMRVQEAIRKTIISRAASRNKMVATGGSLDSEMTGSRFDPRALLAAGSPAGSTSGGELADPAARFAALSSQARHRDELRQWSLDGADLMASLNAQKLAAANRTLAWGLFHREFYRRKLATTSDAATLRRSQSPVSSISTGVSSGSQPSQQTPSGCSAAPTTVAANPGQPFQQQQQPPANRTEIPRLSTHPAKIRHFSSSTSSTSSLLSGQDSLEDSSSHAIDLSSSSETSRNRLQQDSSNLFTRQLPGQQQQQQQQQQFGMLDSQQQMNRFNYQKVLQESFNQLQLCQNMKPMVSAHSLDANKTDQQQQQQQQHPMLGKTNDTAASLDTTGGEFLSSLSQQFNLSASAQNLLALNEQQQSQFSSMLNQHHLQQQQDLNHWLMAYNNLVQSSEFQQSSQISSSLLAKITSLPEPYRSALAQLFQQQHQPQLGLIDQNEANLSLLAGPQQQQPRSESDHKTIIGRALSSPLLIGSSNVNNNSKNNIASAAAMTGNSIEAPMQSVEFEPRKFPNAANILHEQNDVQMVPADQDDRQDLKSIDLSISSSSKTNTPPASDAQQCLVRPPPFGQPGRPDVADKRDTQGALLIPKLVSDKINCNFLYNPIFNQNSSTGLVYELELCNHKCICNNENNHPENSFRVLSIWRRLHDSGLMARCARIQSRRASLSELQLCHGETYANYFGRSPYERIKLRQLDLSKLPIEGLTQLECGGQGADIDTAWNEEQTPGVARLAAGCVIEAATQVASGKLLNAFAVVRPPGHHAEHQQAMGFCFFNSIAIATRVLLNEHQLNRVLIVDWDVHHGNGIQKMFYEDKHVMYISLHRHDRGNFFPGTGDSKEIGAGPGLGYTWNIAWSGDIMGDAEYLAAFRSIVMPIACEFNPSMVLVACGFDGAAGHPFNFGGYELSPACFASMTSQLMSLANGRVVLCLEGGYQLGAICDCAQACVRSLLRDSHQVRATSDPDCKNRTLPACGDQFDMIRQQELEREPNQCARSVLHELSIAAAEHWPSVAHYRRLIDVSAQNATAAATNSK